MEPLVTVFIPTIRRPRMLRDTLGCVTGQRYGNLEILVSDNGSGDETPEVVRRAAERDRRIRFRRNLATVPVHEHFNQCLREAQGRYFCVLSDDDQVNPEFVGGLVHALESHPKAAAAMPRNVVIDGNGEITNELPFPSAACVNGRRFLVAWLWNVRTPPFASAVTMLAETARMRRSGYQNFCRGLNIDNLMLLQLGLQGDIALARESIFYYRVYGQSFGLTSNARNIARSSKQFRRFLRRDPFTQALLRRLDPTTRRLLCRGVQSMTAREFLLRTGFFENPFALRIVARLVLLSSNLLLVRMVLQTYAYHARRLPGAAGAEIRRRAASGLGRTRGAVHRTDAR